MNDHFSIEVIRRDSGETLRPRLGAAYEPFFDLTMRAGRIAPWT